MDAGNDPNLPLQADETLSLKLFVVLSKAYKTMMERATKDMKRHGLSPSEFMIMEVLYSKRSVPLQQIGDKILITSGSVTYNIDKLVEKGLIRRVPSQEDRRIIFAEITAEGDALFDRIFPEHAALIHGMMSTLTAEERHQAAALLKKLGLGIN